MNRWYAVGSILVAVVLAAILFGIASCVHRDWQFEDACRRAGGVVGKASSVTSSSATVGNNADICAKVVQPPISEPIPLPDYRR